jgi:phage-related protein (TIGR01555 family)
MVNPLLNDLPELTQLLLLSDGVGGSAAPSNGLNQLFYNNRYTILGNYRQAISAVYMTNGLVQKFIDMPVDDGFRYGFKVKSRQLGEKRIRDLLQYCDETDVVNKISTAKKWGRLYGGGGIVINCNGETSSPFNIEQVKKNSLLEFIPADLWELAKHDENKPDLWGHDPIEIPYSYYDKPLHKTRVLKIKGKEPTSWDRPRLRNWGMSELERILPELNSHMRAIDLIFELLRQYKIDVWKIKDYNMNLSPGGDTAIVAKRLQEANRTKDYLHAIVMDTEDGFEQRKISLSGLAEILNEIRKGLACVLNIPMTKLFGISASGFNAGDDDLENYNCMIEHEIRAKSKYIIIDILQIISKQMFGIVVKDFEIEWKPLRILTAEQEENVKNSQLNRIMIAFNGGLMDSKEAILAANMNNLLGIEISEKDVDVMGLQQDENNVNINKTGEKKVHPKMSVEEYYKRGYGGSSSKVSSPKPKGAQ